MDFRLKVFVTVAEKLSFTDAAAELNISQPAITNHIKELEKQYGVPLFDRRSGKIKLTYAGEIFLNHAEKILERYNALKFTTEALLIERQGTLRIGANSMMSNYILPPLIAKFGDKHRGIGIIVHTGNNKQVEQALLEGKLDIAFYERDYKKAELSYHIVKREELLLVTSASNRNIAPEISEEELFMLPLIVRDRDSDVMRAIDKGLLDKGLVSANLNAVISFDSTESIKRALLAGNLFSILPRSAVARELAEGELRSIAVTDLTFSCKFHAAHLKTSEDELRVLFSNFTANSVTE